MKYFSTHSSFGKDALKIAAAALAYFLAHHLAFFFPDSEKIIMLVWPAGGVGLAAFLLSPRRLWPALILAFYVAGVTADFFWAGRSLMTGIGYMTGNMVESVGCAWLILRQAKEFRKFDSIREVLALIAGTLFVNAFSSCIGAGTSVLTRGASFGSAWLSWYIADGLGVLLVGPLIVTWIGIRGAMTGLSFKKIIEGVSCIAIWALFVWLIFREDTQSLYLRPYLLVALLSWLAMRLGQRGVTLSLALLFVIAVHYTFMRPSSSFWNGMERDLTYRLLELQLFLGFMAVVGYLMAAGNDERKRAEKSLMEINDKFLRLADNINGHIAYVNADTLQYEFVNKEFEKTFGIPREKIIGRHVRDIIGEENYQFAVGYIEVVKSGKTISYENSFDVVSGKRWLQVNYSPFLMLTAGLYRLPCLAMTSPGARRPRRRLKSPIINSMPR